MEQNFCSNCRNYIRNPICNSCRIKTLAFLMHKYGATPNDISHSVRNMKKRLEQEKVQGEFCILCSTELISLCTGCFASKVKNTLYFYFPKDTADKFFIISDRLMAENTRRKY